MCRASTYKRVLKLGTNSNFQSHDLTTIICCVIYIYIFIYIYIYLNTWHLGVPKFSFKRVRVSSHSNLVRGKLTSPTPNPAGDGTSGLTSYPRRRSKVSEATCLRPQRSAPSRTRTRAVRPRVQRSDHWATHASQVIITSYTHYFGDICTIKHSIYLELLREEKNYQSNNSTLQKRKV